MDFDQLAKVVHDLVQRQNKKEIGTLNSEALQGMTLREQEAVVDGFSKLRLSGHSVVIEIGPYSQWA
ncbi:MULTISPECIES: hypothetical protein [Desulfitobacterium]|uniref:Uncharacterized protein n=1 Tax=Desulfitobacterium dehalogenans (strain ATCC 51507 / DSM 9161 / JW/IU-DC1) TaxID=756499 RepID=I4AAH9_DESDJ|nr:MULTISPECIES: hypothetical protein [Desulfitobacterium]AFM00964.1 hypothetical protein Desde_2647 [Desulfitobacterium dehalogenans ATCC 51507]